MEAYGAALEKSEGAFDVVLETVEAVLEAVLMAKREVLKVVLDPVGLLLHETDTGTKGRLDRELPEPVAAETVATPIVILAVETEALREKSVAKGMGE